MPRSIGFTCSVRVEKIRETTAYAGVGSKAHRPDLLLKIVLYEIHTGRHSPEQWAQDVRDRRSLQWLGFGITPSRTRFYAFRDRIGPWLETLNRQVLESA